MRKIIASEYMTLDGVIEANEEWQFPYFSPDVLEYVRGTIQSAGVFLFGRKTYDIFAAYWPLQTQDPMGIAGPLNRAPKYVVSTTLTEADWNPTTVIRDDVLEEISRLKEQSGGDILVPGSGQLIRSLAQAGLVDEYRLLVHPLVRGRGSRLFVDGGQADLKLVESRPFQSGVVLLDYQAG